VNIRDALVPEDGHQVFARKRRCLQTLPVPVEAANTLLPPDLPLISTPDRPVDTVRLERYVRTAIDRAAGLGIRVIVFGSGAARTCSSDFDRTQAALQVVQHLARWSEWARGSGIRFALEPLRHEESNVINTVAEADAALERIAGSGSG
jgi:sugar phosphate isomerase/epimerase